MQINIGNFLYHQTKEIFECCETKFYFIKHLGEIISCSITFGQIFLGIISYLIHCSSFQYWLYDPFAYYIYISFPQAFLLYSIIAIMPFLMAIIGTIGFFFKSKNTFCTKAFYELIVVNWNQIQQCLINEQQQKEISLNVYLINLSKWKSFFGKIIWNCLPMQMLLRKCCKQWTEISLKFNPKFVDRRKLKLCHLESFPHITLHCRCDLVKFIYFTNYIFYYTHLLTSLFPFALFSPPFKFNF